MFRFGIVSKDRIPDPLSISHSAIAITLVSEFKAPLTERDEDCLTAIYGAMMVGPRMWMTTYPHRFAALDDAIAAVLQQRYDQGRPIRVRDMAASNAVTSLELHHHLTSQFGDRVSTRATDYLDALYVVMMPGSRWEIVCDVTGRPRQFIRGRIVLSGEREPRRYPLNWALQKIVAAALPGRLGLQRAQRIELFHPCCLAAALNDHRFTLGHEDAFSPDQVPCDVMRVMNFTHQMPQANAQRWLTPVCRLVSDGGLLVLGDCPKRDSPMDATIFERQGSQFAPLRDIEGGYQLRQAVVALAF
jgi:hypothetical protein